MTKTVTRTIALARPANQAEMGKLGSAEAVLAVRCSPDGRRMTVTYDLQQIGLSELEGIMAVAGLVLATGFLARLERAWAAFQENNQRAHAKIIHHCCNTPPDDR